MTLLLNRHASAGDSVDWQGDDRLRPLDAKGRRQTEALVPAPGRVRARPDRLEPLLRCVQTVEPLARRATWRSRSTTRSAPTGSTRSRPSSTVCGGRTRPCAPTATCRGSATGSSRRDRSGCSTKRARACPLPASRLGGTKTAVCKGPVEQLEGRTLAQASTRDDQRNAEPSAAPPSARSHPRQASRRARAEAAARREIDRRTAATRFRAWARALALNVRPTRRRSARAVPPVARAARGSGGASPRSNGRLRSRRRQPRRAEADRVRSSAGRASENRCRAT